jgi:hypothetical protein
VLAGYEHAQKENLRKQADQNICGAGDINSHRIRLLLNETANPFL